MASDTRNLIKAQITKKGEAHLRAGHPWVYDSEVISLESPCEDGSLVEVTSPLKAGTLAQDSITAVPKSASA